MPHHPDPPHGDDRRLAEGLRARLPGAVGHVYNVYGPHLFEYAHVLLGDRDLAVESVRAALLVGRDRPETVPDGDRLRAWLYDLVRDECLNRLGVRPEVAADARSLGTATAPPSGAEHRTVARALDQNLPVSGTSVLVGPPRPVEDEGRVVFAAPIAEAPPEFVEVIAPEQAAQAPATHAPDVQEETSKANDAVQALVALATPSPSAPPTPSAETPAAAEPSEAPQPSEAPPSAEGPHEASAPPQETLSPETLESQQPSVRQDAPEAADPERPQAPETPEAAERPEGKADAPEQPEASQPSEADQPPTTPQLSEAETETEAEAPADSEAAKPARLTAFPTAEDPTEPMEAETPPGLTARVGSAFDGHQVTAVASASGETPNLHAPAESESSERPPVAVAPKANATAAGGAEETTLSERVHRRRLVLISTGTAAAVVLTGLLIAALTPSDAPPPAGAAAAPRSSPPPPPPPAPSPSKSPEAKKSKKPERRPKARPASAKRGRLSINDSGCRGVRASGVGGRCYIRLTARGGSVRWSVSSVSGNGVHASGGGTLSSGQSTSVAVSVTPSVRCYTWGRGSGRIGFSPGGSATVTYTCWRSRWF